MFKRVDREEIRKLAQGTGGEEVLFGVHIAIKKRGEDIVIEARARTKNDLAYVKRILDEHIQVLVTEGEMSRFRKAK